MIQLRLGGTRGRTGSLLGILALIAGLAIVLSGLAILVVIAAALAVIGMGVMLFRRLTGRTTLRPSPPGRTDPLEVEADFEILPPPARGSNEPEQAPVKIIASEPDRR